MHRGLMLFAFILLASVPVSASAQDQQDRVRGMAGVYEMSNADRDKICPVTLRADPAQTGFRLEFDKVCATVFPMTRDVVAWNLADEILSLLDARSRSVMEFSEVENGMYEGERPGEGLYFLQSAAAAGPAPRTADQMIGDWSVVRDETKTICTLSLTSNQIAGQESYVLRVKPPCDQIVTRFNPGSWRMDQGELVLLGRGESIWRFEEDDPNTWRRVPEGANPILLVRK